MIGRDRLRELGEARTGPCVSLFLPTVRAGKEVRQNPIRLKNLLQDAERALEEKGAKRNVAETLLAPARALLDDPEFWRQRSDGLAMFLAKDVFVHEAVPAELEPALHVGSRFFLKPLLPLLTGDGRFYLLTLSRHDVRLFAASREHIVSVELENTPRRLEDAVGHDWEQRSLAHHGPAGGSIVHGHGGSGDQDVAKSELLHFVEQVAAGVRKALGPAREPLVLAGTEEAVATFRSVTDYANVFPASVSGSPDRLSEQELHAQAWPLVEPAFLEGRKRAAERFPELRAHGRASDDLADVLLAACDGKVAEIFIATGEERWGRVDLERRKVEVHGERREDDRDLIEEAALHALLHDGIVYAVDAEEVPGDGPVAANLRYA